MELVIILFIVAGIVLFVVYRSVGKEDDKKKKQDERNKRDQEYIAENNVPENASMICCTNIIVQEVPIEGKFNVFLWKENNILNFCGTSVRKMGIPIENVKYYTRTGDSRIETITEGGGANFGKAILVGIGGAIIGYMIGSFIDIINFRIFSSSGLSSILAIVLFVLGALLGGRNKTITKNKEIDNRKTYLYYSEANEDKNMIFTSKAYDVLLKLIPEKEMSYIENNKIIKADDKENDNVYKDIEKLSELKDKGILTEDEFNSKKQLLLDKIQ